LARILVVDDDRSVLDMLAMAFEDDGHEVATALDGLIGHRKAREWAPSLIVSDVNMPGLDGFSLCRRLRNEGRSVPIILLTARDSEIDEALGLELGADDYVVKPFSSRILKARVSALLRREALRHSNTAPIDPLQVRHLALDPERLEARYRGTAIVTTVTEFRLISVLAKRPGVVFTRGQLLRKIRDDDSVVVERLIDTYVRRLRRKFEEIDATFDEIETLIGAGYRWRDRSG
jgi:DNA-binding response OmpR family regulator